MDEPWYSCISRELDDVEALMCDTMRSENSELTEMCNYVISVHGKRIRPSMCILSYYACGGSKPKKAIDVGSALELIHNATLIHDDINDEGELRRGRKTLYREYSLGKSIVTGDYIFALGFRLIGSASPDIVDFVVDASASMGAGEFNQKDFEHKGCVSESDYMKIIDGKTAKFIECAAKSGSFLAGSDTEVVDALGHFAQRAGMAFQIVDDTLDVIGNESATGKSVGNDILEGKPTLPIILAMQDLTHGKEIREIFEKEKPTPSEVIEALRLIKMTDAVSKCIEKAENIVNDAVRSLDVISDSIYKTALINMAYYFVSRDR
ncbi:MAG: polyprenyl synthetase family protein [Candidatus Methanomethylophilaceae archaeon]|nr:polyprenyl synthetase family protein [Candidatus Methanomethylophilaceae archaeon]MDD3378391.1 polyprenyl synthetase family protein [Candidatus Methanomethylophilaceae archaeon]MDY0224255.1 polyprenyl synthetase family protein [Candidatus Methanomethylophilaceae archaeon]